MSKMRAQVAADARVTSGALIFRVRAVSLGGWGWVFRVNSLNSREAALRPLPFDILKRATRRRPKKKQKMNAQVHVK